MAMLESRLVPSHQAHIFRYQLSSKPGLRRLDQQFRMVLRYEPEVLSVAHTQSIPSGYGKLSTSPVFVK